MAKFDENVAAKYIAKISILNFFTEKTNVNKGFFLILHHILVFIHFKINVNLKRERFIS